MLLAIIWRKIDVREVKIIYMAIALAVTKEKAAGRIYHVAEPETLSEGERVTKIGEPAGWKGKVVRTIEWERNHPSTEMQQLVPLRGSKK